MLLTPSCVCRGTGGGRGPRRWDGRGGGGAGEGGGEGGGEDGQLHLMVHSGLQNESVLKTGSCVCQFNISLDLRVGG